MKCDSAQTQLQCLLDPNDILGDPMWELDLSINADSIIKQIKNESDSADDKDFSDEDSIPVSTCMYNFHHTDETERTPHDSLGCIRWQHVVEKYLCF